MQIFRGPKSLTNFSEEMFPICGKNDSQLTIVTIVAIIINRMEDT